jgi:hypothetical protein
MAAVQLIMDAFKFEDDHINTDWPTWLFRFENFLLLTNIDILIPAQAVVALRHLLHSGGAKVGEIFAAQGNLAMTYGQFRDILNARFTTPVNRLHIMTLRHCVQGEGQSLEDFITQLQRLAINAGIIAPNRDNEILNVIAHHASNEETRVKACTPDITLAQLRAWRSAQDAIAKCMKVMNKAREEPINAISQAPPRQCFNCGLDYPHPLGTTCPALGQECRRCHRMDHYARVCFKERGRRPYESSQHSNRTPNSYNRSQETPTRDRSRGRFDSRDQSRGSNDNRERQPWSERKSANNKRDIRQVNEEGLFEKFKQYLRQEKDPSTDEASSPEEEQRRRTPKASRYTNNSD